MGGVDLEGNESKKEALLLYNSYSNASPTPKSKKMGRRVSMVLGNSFSVG